MTDHQPPPAVEAIGRLEADLRNRNLYREDEFFVLKVREDDLRALLADHHAQAESLRHSVEREAGLREALEPFAALADFDAALTERWESRTAPPDGDAVICWAGGFGLKAPVVTYGHFRKARAALDRRAEP